MAPVEIQRKAANTGEAAEMTRAVLSTVSAAAGAAGAAAGGGEDINQLATSVWQMIRRRMRIDRERRAPSSGLGGGMP